MVYRADTNDNAYAQARLTILDKYQHFRHYEHFDLRKRVSKLSDEKELACLWSANETIKKQTEEFNGILHASFRTKMPTSDKVMPHDQMHWLKTLIFTHLLFIYLTSLQFSMDGWTTGRTQAWIQDFLSGGGGGGGGGLFQA